MALLDDLKSEVAKIFRESWTERDGRVVPDTESLKLGNDAIKLTATVLYADLTGSTKLVHGYKPHFAAEVYKSYLHCAAKISRSEGGEITAYDGDRIMAVFVGDSKNTSAARAALKINYARTYIVNPAIDAQYPKVTYRVSSAVGIDTSSLYVAKTGIRGSNDLVWVGRSANYAAKLTELDSDYPTWITDEVYRKLTAPLKTGSDGRSMWEARTWTSMGGLRIHRSNWWWKV